MASHWGQMTFVPVDTYADFERIADETGANKIKYCEHIGSHYTLMVGFEGVCYQYVMAIEDPASTEQTDFETTRKSSALKIS